MQGYALISADDVTRHMKRCNYNGGKLNYNSVCPELATFQVINSLRFDRDGMCLYHAFTHLHDYDEALRYCTPEGLAQLAGDNPVTPEMAAHAEVLRQANEAEKRSLATALMSLPIMRGVTRAQAEVMKGLADNWAGSGTELIAAAKVLAP